MTTTDGMAAPPGPEGFPVGGVVSYAGQATPGQLHDAGWQVCDGSPLDVSGYPDLFAVIGTCNGGDGSTNFNVPDYRGRFLRGVDLSGKRDPDATTRKPAADGGNPGPRVGSVQGWATGLPRNNFAVNVPHLPRTTVGTDTGSSIFAPGATGGYIYSNAGGDAETRPINAYVNFIIKWRPGAEVPIGAVFPYPGISMPSLNWCLACVGGAPLPRTTYPDLYSAIGNAHGGDDKNFNLPDYRGRFLRGADNNAKRDPDADGRTEMAAGGNRGPGIGSVQGYATGQPNYAFSATVPWMSNVMLQGETGSSDPGAAFNLLSVDVKVSQAGGDKESRPPNVNVNYIILSRSQLGTDRFPVGGVIGVPGDVPPDATMWFLCDGTQKSTTTNRELFTAIGYCNGGAGPNFNLPDYRGYFLRGADLSAGRDPDAQSRTVRAPLQRPVEPGSVQDWATGRPTSGNPINDITAKFPNLPEHARATYWFGIPIKVALWAEDPTPVTLSGGDDETRPINASIHFYIKYRLAGGLPE